MFRILTFCLTTGYFATAQLQRLSPNACNGEIECQQSMFWDMPSRQDISAWFVSLWQAPVNSQVQVLRGSGTDRLADAQSKGADGSQSAMDFANQNKLLFFLLIIVPITASWSRTKEKGHKDYGTFQATSIAENEQEAMSVQQLLVRGIAICIPCLAAGYNLAVIGAGLTSLNVSFGVSHSQLGWVAASSCIGSIAGAVVCSSAVDIFGRLQVHFHLTILLFIAQCLMAVSTSYYVFVAGRFLVGIACGCATALAPLYLAEIAPKDRRGLLVSLTEQTISGGLMFGFAAAAFQSFTFREYALLGVGFPVATLLLTPLLSESPRWLIRQGRIDEARAILKRYVSSGDEIEQTIKACSRSIDAAEEEQVQEPSLIQKILSPLLDYMILFKDAATRGHLFLPAALSAFEEFVGIEVSDDYCVKFLEEAGVPSRFWIANITTWMVILKGIVLIISGFLLDSWGRRPALLLSLGGQAVSLIALAMVFNNGVWQVSALIWLLYNLFYGAGLGNVCMVVMAESFPDPKTRAVGVSFCFILNRVVAAVLTGLYPLQRTFMTGPEVFMIWAAFAVVGFIGTYFLMAERMGTMLEDAD
jgi:MFS family permease